MRRTRQENEREALAEVRSVYAEFAGRPLERACTQSTGCCRFRLTGRTPHLTRGEAILAARAVRSAGRKVLPTRDDGACPLLGADGRCLIYHDRPFGCRTHFCADAGGLIPRAEVLDLIRRLEAIDTRLGGTGSHELEAAVTDELRRME